MKNYKLWNIGDHVVITNTHGNDLGMAGIITEVRHSFCKIKLENNSIVNHTYGQFKRNED